MSKDLLQLSPSALEVQTYAKTEQEPSLPFVKFGLVKTAGETLALAVNDEIPLFLAVKGKWMYATAISLQEAWDGSAIARAKLAFESEGLDLADVEAVLGPSLTFSHVEISEEQLRLAYDRGYRLACKGTSGKRFLDPQMLVVIYLRRWGVLPEHILISDYDTFENPDLLYSASRGDQKKNVVVGTLRA